MARPGGSGDGREDEDENEDGAAHPSAPGTRRTGGSTRGRRGGSGRRPAPGRGARPRRRRVLVRSKSMARVLDVQVAALAEVRHAAHQQGAMARPVRVVAERAVLARRRVLPQEGPAHLRVALHAGLGRGGTGQHGVVRAPVGGVAARAAHGPVADGMPRRAQAPRADLRVAGEAGLRLRHRLQQRRPQSVAVGEMAGRARHRRAARDGSPPSGCAARSRGTRGRARCDRWEEGSGRRARRGWPPGASISAASIMAHILTMAERRSRRASSRPVYFAALVYLLYSVLLGVAFVASAPFYLWKGRGSGKYLRTLRASAWAARRRPQPRGDRPPSGSTPSPSARCWPRAALVDALRARLARAVASSSPRPRSPATRSRRRACCGRRRRLLRSLRLPGAGAPRARPA